MKRQSIKVFTFADCILALPNKQSQSLKTTSIFYVFLVDFITLQQKKIARIIHEAEKIYA